MEHSKNHFQGKSKFMIFLFGYFLIWYINILIPVEGNLFHGLYRIRIAYISNIILALWALVISIKNHKDITKKDYMMAILLGVLSTSGRYFLVGICTFLCYIASKILMRRYPQEKNILFSENKKELMKDISIIFIVALCFLGINILANNLGEMKFDFNIINFIDALMPGISEEILFRLFIYFLACTFLKGHPYSKSEENWTYMIMIIPFVIMHIPDYLISYGLFSMLLSSISLFAITGLFTYLFFKRNLFTVIAIHILIDFINFSIY